MVPPGDGKSPGSVARSLPTRWTEFILWLNEMSRDLPLIYGKYEDGEICDRLIAALRGLEEEDRAFAEFALGPAVQQCFGGVHSMLRAVGAGYIELTPALRAELVAMVREVTQVVMTHDLEPPSGAS